MMQARTHDSVRSCRAKATHFWTTMRSSGARTGSAPGCQEAATLTLAWTVRSALLMLSGKADPGAGAHRSRASRSAATKATRRERCYADAAVAWAADDVATARGLEHHLFEAPQDLLAPSSRSSRTSIPATATPCADQCFRSRMLVRGEPALWTLSRHPRVRAGGSGRYRSCRARWARGRRLGPPRRLGDPRRRALPRNARCA